MSTVSTARQQAVLLTPPDSSKKGSNKLDDIKKISILLNGHRGPKAELPNITGNAFENLNPLNLEGFFMNCRGEAARRIIVEKYHLTPVAHTRLLPGQTKVSCAGPVLTDSYYCFSYESKLDANDKGTFICGNDSGKDFLDLLGQPNLPLFDPLSGEDIQGNGTSGGGAQHNEGEARVWNPVAKQLWEVINMVIVCRSNPVNGLLLEIKTELDNEPQTSPIYLKIKSVNTIVGKLFQSPTFTQKINEIRSEHPRLRQYHWDLLNEILASKSIVSNFP